MEFFTEEAEELYKAFNPYQFELQPLVVSYHHHLYSELLNFTT